MLDTESLRGGGATETESIRTGAVLTGASAPDRDEAVDEVSLTGCGCGCGDSLEREPTLVLAERTTLETLLLFLSFNSRARSPIHLANHLRCPAKRTFYQPLHIM